MKIPRLKTLRLCVADVKASALYYESLFGVRPSEEQDNFALFNLSGTHLELVVADRKNPLSTGGSIGYFETECLKETIERAKSIGGEIWRGPLTISENGWSIVQIKDTEGNIIGLEGILAEIEK